MCWGRVPAVVPGAGYRRRPAVSVLPLTVCCVGAEFRPLFRERDIAAGRLTVLVVSQRTEQDMATWSEQVEAERLELASQVGDARRGRGTGRWGGRDIEGGIAWLGCPSLSLVGVPEL